MNDITVWAQMFFHDASVSCSLKVPAEYFYDPVAIEDLINLFLRENNRTEGVLMMWGGGRVVCYSQNSIFSSLESNC